MVLVQKWPFVRLFFLGSIGQENILNDILERKNAFLGYKKKKFKKSKIYSFPRRLTHGFGPKMVIFSTFLVGNTGHKNILTDIVERKSAFLGCKNKMFKMSNNRQFSKGVNPWFRSKNGHFYTCFF